MDTQELRTLKLLEEIESEQSPSQRDLATRLNISLGLVNAFMKRLAKKGYFKITNIPRNRMRYILTPKGAAEKTRLTYEYIQYFFQFYKNARSKLNTLFRDFEKQRIERVAFFGAGELAEIAFISLQETSITLAGIVDDVRAGERFIGMRIVAPEEIQTLKFQKIVVTDIESSGGAMKEILGHGIARSKIALL